ncbi:MAG: M48 family metallopeptidase, partial [Betaproteobacteria bacterium]|nr:M48 family metallopeptidase [Betaproteobacteria bacterium]
MRELSLDGVSIELVRKRIKNIYLRVLSPSGQIRISVPLRVSDMAVREFLLSKLAWIHDRRQHVCAAVPQYTRTFADGEEILFWGRPRRIRFFPVGG